MQKNTGIIVSLREEYLADFLKRFDMNNLLSKEEGQDINPRGILKKMFSVIENNADTPPRDSSLLRQIKTTVWKDHSIKNNASVHLDTQARVVTEKMGSTLLYGRNQNEMRFQLNGEISNTSVLESKCRKLFGESDGSALFHKHIQEPLIEQQIIFHMAEFNQKILRYPTEELHAFIGKDMEHYLFPNLFEKNGHEQLMKVVKQLETIQLIRKNTEGSELEYEIAHDFIATAYSNYCSTNMKCVRTTLLQECLLFHDGLYGCHLPGAAFYFQPLDDRME